MELSADESDIQIISDHFTSQRATPDNGTTAPVHDRFRMFVSDASSSPQVNPASYHAFQKAYDDLKARFNDVSEKNTQMDRHLRNLRAQLNEQSGMANGRQRYNEEVMNSDDAGEREDSLQLRRKYFELSQEYRKSVEETSTIRQELLTKKKRIAELEQTNRSLLVDNQKMTASMNTLDKSKKGTDQQHVEQLSRNLRELEASYNESNKKCLELQQQLTRNKAPEQASTEELKALTSQVKDILQARISGPLSDDDYATLVKFQLEAAARDMVEMAAVIQQQQGLLQQLLLQASSRCGDSRKRHTLPKVMTRSAPSPGMLDADPDIVSVEFPSNAEIFPVILQPRGNRELLRNQRPLSNITEATSEMSSSGRTSHLLPSQHQNGTTSAFLAARSSNTGNRRSSDQGRLSKSDNNATALNTYQWAQQCSDDVFMENVKENKDAIMQEYIDEQRNSPLVHSPRTKFQNPWMMREPVGTVFGVAPTEHLMPDDRAAGDLQLRPPASQSSLEMEEHPSLRRDVPVVNHGRPNEDGDFSFMDDFKTTVQRLEEEEPNDRAQFAFELNDENRRHPAAFNQQPRQLNIDRNYNEDARRTGSYDNTATNRNINLASSAQVVDKHPDTGYASAGNNVNPPVLNNDPLWTPKTVPSQNLYRNHEQEVPERPTPPSRTPEVERTCPVCERDFPSTIQQSEIENHVENCLVQSMHAEEASRTWTNVVPPDSGAEAGPTVSGPENKCPVCLQQFSETTPVETLQRHINSHFENHPAPNEPLNFEILEGN